jgi:hypothetical protein
MEDKLKATIDRQGNVWKDGTGMTSIELARACLKRQRTDIAASLEEYYGAMEAMASIGIPSRLVFNPLQVVIISSRERNRLALCFPPESAV